MMALADYLIQPDGQPVAQVQQHTVQTPPAEQVQQPIAPEQVVTSKPKELSSMPDDEYAELSKVMAPEQLVKVYGNYDPNSTEPIYQTLYKATQRKPAVPEERRVKAANTISGVTDALGMLVQGVTGAKGGLVPLQAQTATQNNNANIQRMRDLYHQENERYNAGLFNAVMRDIESGRQGYQSDRANLLNMLSDYRNRKYQSERDAARDALQKEQYDADMAYKEKEFEESVRRNKANEAILWKQANTAATRADAYAVGQQTKGGEVPKGYVDYLDPNTNTYYRINEKKLKSFVPQMFKAMEQDIFRDNVSIKRRYDALTPNERLDFVMQNWPSSPAAVQYMEQLKDSKFPADPVTTGTENTNPSSNNQVAVPSGYDWGQHKHGNKNTENKTSPLAQVLLPKYDHFEDYTAELKQKEELEKEEFRKRIEGKSIMPSDTSFPSESTRIIPNINRI